MLVNVKETGGLKVLKQNVILKLEGRAEGRRPGASRNGRNGDRHSLSLWFQ